MRLSESEMQRGSESALHVETTIFITDALGLHARPAAKLAQAAQQFESDISLEYESMTVDAKSILDILTLAAGQGASLTLRCKGMDAAYAASELSSLFGTGNLQEA
jgi:Phosphotransferase System HPr (HPr) Family